METLFDPGELAALRRTVDRMPMPTSCAAAMDAAKSAGEEESPLFNLEYRPPPVDVLAERRPSTAGSLTEAVAKILEIDVQPAQASNAGPAGQGAAISGRMVLSGSMSAHIWPIIEDTIPQ